MGRVPMYVRCQLTTLLLRNRITKSTLLHCWHPQKYSQTKAVAKYPHFVILQPQSLKKTIYSRPKTCVSMMAPVKKKYQINITPKVVH